MNRAATGLLRRSACTVAVGLALVTQAVPALAQISIGITLAPPPLPVYEQPALDEDGDIWTPGYWSYGPDGYVWVPGAWEQPPQAGFLWTPGYWGWGDGGYLWNAGYWGPTVGYYGGIDYGYGYSGRGYEGGRWRGGHVEYNTAVSHVNVSNIHHVYDHDVGNRAPASHVSFNGGRGGTAARPTASEQTASHAAGRADGKSRPVAAHAADLPPVGRERVPASGNAARDRNNQQAQETLRNTQEAQRKALQSQQASEHEAAARQSANESRNQDLERQHQAQTQQLTQRHAAEQQSLHETQQRRPEARPSEPRQAPQQEQRPEPRQGGQHEEPHGR